MNMSSNSYKKLNRSMNIYIPNEIDSVLNYILYTDCKESILASAITNLMTVSGHDKVYDLLKFMSGKNTDKRDIV